MGSRIRENPDHIFECFCEVVCPSSSGDEPWILQKFPENFNSEELLKPLPQFTFPCPITFAGVQHFSFVLTNIDGKWTYGFCRHSPDSQTSLCILSYLPWHESFYKILNFVAEMTSKAEQNDLWKFLQALYDMKIPQAHSEIKFSINDNIFSHFCPNYSKLPSIPENRNLTEYFNAIDPTNMITIFASMLFERRILITSKKLNRLSASVQAANSLIYPMNWQHIFIPVLPSHLVDYLSAPMPFLVGVPASIMTNVKKSELGEAVILDVDENVIQSPFDDLNAIPSDIISSLKKRLKNPQNMLGDGVALAFVRALVHIIGGYRDALRLKPGEQITFSDDAFIQSRPQSIQPFLEKMLNLQIFRQFIEERLEKLNSGNGFSDDFEFEINKYSEKNSLKLKTQYREWVTNMKKEGGAFLKTVKSKTNPAVKHAYKSVKDKSKRAYKDFRTKFHDLQSKQIDISDFQSPRNIETMQQRSAPSSPTSPRASNANWRADHHISLLPSTKTYVREKQAHTLLAMTSDLKSKDGTDGSKSNNNFSDDIPDYKTIDMDLMGDLQDILFRKCSMSSSNSSPSLETAGCISGTQSMNEFSSSLPSCSKPEAPSLIKLGSIDNSDDFDPLKSTVSTLSPSDSLTLDVLRELEKPRSSSITQSANPFISMTYENVGSTSSGNPFRSSLNDNTIVKQQNFPGLNNNTPSNLEINGKIQSNDLAKVPILQPISSTSSNIPKNTPQDPFADLVSWNTKTQLPSNNSNCQWQKFD